MPDKPGVHAQHTNVWLSNMASKWMVEDRQFVAGQIFPIVTVQKLTDLIARYDRRDWFRAHDVRPRAPGSESQGTGYGIGSGSYYCREYAVHKDIPDEERANADLPFRPDMDSTQIITQLLKIKRDYLFAQFAFAAGVWTTQFAGTVAASNYGAGGMQHWSNYLTPSTPIQDVEYAKQYMHLLTGFQPNTLVVNKCVWGALKHHPQIIARYLQTQAVPQLTPQLVANVFELDRVIVAEAIMNHGPEQGQWIGRPVFGNHALLAYVQPSPSTTMPSAGYTFAYTGANHQGYAVQIEQFRLANDSKSDRLTGNFVIDPHVVEPDLGVFIQNIVAPGFCLGEVVADITGFN